MWDQIEITRTVRQGEVEQTMTVRFPKPRFASELATEVKFWMGVMEEALVEEKTDVQEPVVVQ